MKSTKVTPTNPVSPPRGTGASTKRGTRSSGSRVRSLLSIVVATLVAAALIAVAVRSPGPSATSPTVACASRVIVIDTSSGSRSSQLTTFADQLIDAAAQSAVICEEPLSAYGVSGGGIETPIITSDNLAALTPIGPTPQVRSLRFDSAQQVNLSRLIATRLAFAYRVGDPSITSVGAMYEVASEHFVRSGDVILVTDGVNDDTQINLNQPLTTGEGARLAKKIRVSSLRGEVVTLVGLAQVDSNTPPPSPVWPHEIDSFNATLCHATRAAQCHLFGAASVSEVLNSKGA